LIETAVAASKDDGASALLKAVQQTTARLEGYAVSMPVTKDDVIRFVRRDGPLAARVVFLTIEDGCDIETREAFESYYSNPAEQVWEPTPPLADDDYGLPGKYIPQLMLALHGMDVGLWRLYKLNHLYVQDCCNIKYYPIAKKKQDQWPEFLKDNGDFTREEYWSRCHSSERHDAILRQHGAAFSRDKLIVILGAHNDAWAPFLASRIFPGERLVSLEEVHDAAGKFVGKVVGTEQGAFRYCYFWMFRRPPIYEADLTKFAQAVKVRAAHLIPPAPQLAASRDAV
jgi:hypothetical protein